jgi:hypothetical protein
MEKTWRWCSSNAWRWLCNYGNWGKMDTFKDEPHNVRLSLEVDGVNPFGELSFIYSMWPIFVINNNIPPWMSIMREHIMLTMIVPGICLH